MNQPYTTLPPSSPGDGGTPQSASLLTHEALERFSYLAEQALMSQDAAARLEAGSQLLTLSSYDSWGEVKSMLPLVQNNCLRFVVCKAILFMVSNEIGPEERAEVQHSLIGYLASADDGLPQYIKNQVFLILATALFSNWKMAVIRAEDGAAATMDAFIATLAENLPPADVLACLAEVVNVFAQQNRQLRVVAVVEAFCVHVAPHVFEYASRQLAALPRPAATLCCVVLETLPLGGSERAIVRFNVAVEEPTVTLSDWRRWAPPVRLALDYCTAAITREPLAAESVSLYGRLLRLLSTVRCPQEEFLADRESVSTALLGFAEQALAFCTSRPLEALPVDLLSLAVGIVVNTFERDVPTTSDYLRSNAAVLFSWQSVTRAMIDRFGDDDEADLRRQLMHLFYLVGVHLVRARRRPLDRLERPLTDVLGDETPTRGGGPSDGGLPDGPDAAAEAVQGVFEYYLATVLRHAPVTESSTELRNEEGLMLHTERLLCPLSEMLFCERVSLTPLIIARLRQSVQHYFRCVALRERLSVGGNPDAATRVAMGELFAAVMLDEGQDGGVGGVSVMPLSIGDAPAWRESEAGPLYLMHVILSRLSVLISVVAIAIANRTSYDDDVVLPIILDFASSLLDSGSLTTNDLLTCLTLDNDGAGTMGNINGSGSNGNATVHIGVLRALFFLCVSLCDANRDTSAQLCDISLLLLRYTYLNHSDIACLVSDANGLLLLAARGRLGGSRFLFSDTLGELLTAVESDAVGLLQAQNLSMLGPDELSARAGMLRATSMCAEVRLYAGYGYHGFHRAVTRRVLDGGRLLHSPRQALTDLAAITDGCHQPDPLASTLGAALECDAELRELVRRGQREATEAMLEWLAAAATLSIRLIRRDVAHELPWQLASLMLFTLNTYYDQLRVTPPGASEPVFGTDCADPAVVYHAADILFALSGNTWCQLGVVMYYERAAVLRAFCGSLQLLLATSVPRLLSDASGQVHLVASLMALVAGEDRSLDGVNAEVSRRGLWRLLLRQLTACLNYKFNGDLLRLMLIIVRADTTRRIAAGLGPHAAAADAPHHGPNGVNGMAGGGGGAIPIDSDTIARVFHEVLVALASAPFMEASEIDTAFQLLACCYSACSANCEFQARKLLDFASAYHRVRIRMAANLIAEGKPGASSQYMSVFGQTTKTTTLSAW